MSEPDESQLLSVAQAISIIDSAAVLPRVVRAPLAEALGCVLAEDLYTDRDYPPFDKSLMDGYAVRAADVPEAPVVLRVIGEIAAGGRALRALGPGEAFAIMTGAPLPPGADAVVPVEETERAGEVVEIRSAVKMRRFITPRGGDAPAGQRVLERGIRLGAPQIAAAATIGADPIAVHTRPRAAVLATGDEIVPVSAIPGESQIRNSNSPMLLALLDRLGCERMDLGHCPDDPEALRAAIGRGLEQADVLLISGGMSMGQYDYVPKLLVEAGVQLQITRLRIKPGKPFVFGVKGSGFGVGGSGKKEERGTFVFGLPGNPVSSFVCTVRLASRLLARLAGETPREDWVSGILERPLGANGPREFYQPVRLQWDAAGARMIAHPLEWKGSADVFTLALADGLLMRPENDVPREAGEAVRVLLIT